MGWVEKQKVKNPKILPNKFLKGEKNTKKNKFREHKAQNNIFIGFKNKEYVSVDTLFCTFHLILLVLYCISSASHVTRGKIVILTV